MESHVALIVLENREYDEVVGDPEAPFLNRLARRGALATRYHGVAHPSLPNYLALLGGSTFGIDENCVECRAAGPNLATQLSRAGTSWRAYMGGLPSACYPGAEYGEYVKRHNPFMYFPAITSRPGRCARVVPEARLSADLRRHRLPAFSWLSPGLCADAHNCALSVADRRLSRLVPRLTRQLGPHGLLIVTFDEGTSDAGCCGGAHGGRVMTLLVGPDVRHGVRLKRAYDHYSLLATLEDRFGLPRLRHARAARVIRAALGRLGPDRLAEG
ncbi:MAG: alkaline phosphatase family protein [Solirubrobacterales bacterium]